MRFTGNVPNIGTIGNTAVHIAPQFPLPQIPVQAPAAPAPAPAAAAPTPAQSAAPSIGTYDPNSDFGKYLNSHPTSVSAWDYTAALLEQYGLGALASFAKDAIVQGYSSNEIVQRLRETPQYKQRFSGLVKRQEQGLAPLSEADYVNMERGYQQALASVGISPDYLTQQQMADMIFHDKSPTELQHQLVSTYQEISTHPDLAPQLQRLYGMGVSPGEAAAFFLDPTHTEAYLTQKVTAAQMAARAQQTGFGQLNVGQAEHLAGLGISDAQAAQGFGNLSQQKGLLVQNASEGNSISQDTALSATFDNNAEAQKTLTTRLAERKGAFSGGGNFTDPNKQGVTGAGVSNA
jgi:hypothetical protein